MARNIHYVMVEAEENPKKAPLVFWFAGGPGGSSMIDLVFGLGPFTIENMNDPNTRFNSSTAIYNNQSMTKRVNMIYVDNPSGVGYSYAERKLDVSTNDD